MHASRRPPPPPVAEYPPLTLVRAMVTQSLSSNKEPRRLLDTLKLPSAVYYYVEAKGFLPDQNYQVRVLVLDGANKVVGDHHFSITPRQAQHIHWFPIIPRETHAPGLWTFRMYFGRNAPASQLVAETRIEASAQGGQEQTARLERLAPAVAIAVVALLAYIAYNMVVFGRTPVGAAQATPGGATAEPGGGVARALLDPSLAALIAVNLLPLGLALFAGANAADILFMYWVENLVIALYTLLRMVAARGLGAKYTSPLLFIPLFILHFGMFCTAHLGILLQYMWEHSNLFALNAHGMLNPRTAAEFDRAARDLWDVVPFAFVLQVSLLLISHGLSFVHNYLKGDEYLLAEPRTEMMRPYYRVGIMHVAAIATGCVAMAQGSPLVMLVILVLLKTGLDAYLHLRSHLPHLPPLTSPQ